MKITTYADADQFARDYAWEDTQPTIEDPEYAASEILSALDAEEQVALDVRGHLHAALVASAERENARRTTS